MCRIAAEELLGKMAETHCGRGNGAVAKAQLCTWRSLSTTKDPTSYQALLDKLSLSDTCFSLDTVATMAPDDWWKDYGQELPVLQRLAGVLYTVPATAAGNERSNSVFKFVWSDKRARMLTGRVAMLVTSTSTTTFSCAQRSG